MIILQTETRLDLIDCCSCGIRFGVPTQLNQNRIDNKDFWYCPNGHSQHYTGKTLRTQFREAALERDVAQEEAVRLVKQVAALRRRAKKSK